MNRNFRYLLPALVLILVAGALVTSFPIYGAGTPAHHAGGKPITVVGYIRDPGCLLSGQASGESHRACALVCAKAGTNLVLEDAKTHLLYVLLAAKPGENPNAMTMQYAERKVKVTGTLESKGGLSAIVLKKVEASK